MPEFELSWTAFASIVISATVIYLAVILFTRIHGVRSFAKISSFDFAMTVAVGSTMASTIVSREAKLLPGLLAVVMLFLLQAAVGALRKRSRRLQRLVDNEPVLLMDGPDVLEQNLHDSGLTRDDLREKLRESNVLTYDQVLAVVFETTGNVSVLKRSGPDDRLESDLLRSVRR